MLFHVVEGVLRNSLLKNEVFQLMAIAVVLYSCCYFTEAVEENFIISTVFLIIPEQREDMGTWRLSKNLPVILTTLSLTARTYCSSETQKSYSDPCHLRIRSKAPFLELHTHTFLSKMA